MLSGYSENKRDTPGDVPVRTVPDTFTAAPRFCLRPVHARPQTALILTIFRRYYAKKKSPR